MGLFIVNLPHHSITVKYFYVRGCEVQSYLW